MKTSDLFWIAVFTFDSLQSLTLLSLNALHGLQLIFQFCYLPFTSQQLLLLNFRGFLPKSTRIVLIDGGDGLAASWASAVVLGVFRSGALAVLALDLLLQQQVVQAEDFIVLLIQ